LREHLLSVSDEFVKFSQSYGQWGIQEFVSMGYFPAKLFLGVASNVQFKID
jgi:hypothetical protein